MSNVEAQALAYVLEIGAAGIREAQAWAEAEISSTSAPSEELLELATVKASAEAISLLHALGVKAERSSVGRRVYVLLLAALQQNNISHEQVAELVVRLARENYAPSIEAEDESWYFDDAFYLASEGIYGSRSEVATELEDHLRKYTP